ncbi:pyridoxamine 5'-phosphate oxidase family protein [Luteimonas sp. SJ-92]|uniref:Pyridoxamine 5'-phosphate oxidase family protein n=1 Tax=Luteimonas salinisoli TaxID=2752307 RepID=A0A853JF20_9GAMM|nr:pyridoxamine 5'-phosphate oxidase family protein [Luteimonas salinisoli]NZA27364.1 pyridoxamine 5'-phosphate oxidase family protein [Luteimonas salinisoli]
MSDPDRSEHIRKLAGLIEDVDIAMLTTIGPDGRLVSRPLGTQEVEFDGDLWFATGADSGKVAEIRANPHVNVAYASPSKNVYVSVAGIASIVDDREKIERFWSPAMKIYFPEGKDDPNLRLIRVGAQSAEYWDGPGSAVGKALYLATAAVTGDAGAMSDNERIDLS